MLCVPWHVSLQRRESVVQPLQHPNHSELFLRHPLGPLQGGLGVEREAVRVVAAEEQHLWNLSFTYTIDNVFLL